MKSAIDTLMTEHRLIERVLEALSDFTDSLGGNDGERDRLGDFVTFLRTFADKCHHGKEEALLFQEMTRYGMPAEAGPVGMMLHEHEEGRALVGKLAAAAEGTGTIDDREREEVQAAARQFIVLLTQHIQKEDNVLYPMAQNLLPAEIMVALAEKFDDFERTEMGEGIHEEMHGLADSLLAGTKG